MKLTTISFPELLKEDAQKISPIHKAIKASCVSLTLFYDRKSENFDYFQENAKLLQFCD